MFEGETRRTSVMGRILTEQRALLEASPMFIAAGASLDPRAPLPAVRARR